MGHMRNEHAVLPSLLSCRGCPGHCSTVPGKADWTASCPPADGRVYGWGQRGHRTEVC